MLNEIDLFLFLVDDDAVLVHILRDDLLDPRVRGNVQHRLPLTVFDVDERTVAQQQDLADLEEARLRRDVQRTSSVDLLTKLDFGAWVLEEKVHYFEDTGLRGDLKRCPEVDAGDIRVNPLDIEQVLGDFYVARRACRMQAAEPFRPQQIQVDFLIRRHFRLFSINMLVVVEDFILAELVVELDELFKGLAISYRVRQSLDDRGGVVGATGLDLVQSLLDDAKFLQIARVLAGSHNFINAFFDVLKG